MIALRLALRHLRARPAAALVTLLGVAFGVAGVRAMALGADGALATLRATYEGAAGPARWVALPAGDPRGTLPAEAVRHLATAPGVTGTVPLLTRPTVRAEEAKLWFGVLLPEGDAGLLLVGADAPGWRSVAGAATPTCTPGCPLAGASVLVGEAWAHSRDLAPGDALHLAVGGRLVPVTIGGLVDRTGLGSRGFGRVVIAPLAAVREGLGLPADAVGELGLVTDRPPPPWPGVVVVEQGDRGADVEQRLANVRAGTDLLSGVTLLLAGLLVAGQAAARATERTRALALLRAVGATRGQVVAALLAETALVAAPGAALGLALGSPLADGVAFALGQAAQADLRVGVIDAPGAALAAGLGILTAVLAALLPALHAARAAPLAGLRARGRAAAVPGGGLALAGASGLLLLAASFLPWPAATADRTFTLARVLLGLVAAVALLPPLLPRLVPRLAAGLPGLPAPVALGLASLRWRPLRSGLAAGTVLVCVAMVGGVGALGHGVRAELDRWSSRVLGHDLYASRPDGFTAAELATIRALPGVTEAVGVAVRPVIARVGDHDAALALVGVEPGPWARVLEVVGGGDVADLGPGEALVPTVVAAQLGVEVGDEITAGDLHFRVRALVVDYLQNGFAVIVPRAALPDARLDVVAVRGDAREALQAMPGVTVESRDDLRGRILRLADASMAALDVLLWLAGAVGVLAVGAALAQATLERRADLAVLRAVGLERRHVPILLVAEGVATALAGVLPGLPAGILLGWVFSAATATLGVPVPYVPPWTALLGAGAAALVTAAAAAWLPGRRAAEGSPMDAVREG